MLLRGRVGNVAVICEKSLPNDLPSSYKLAELLIIFEHTALLKEYVQEEVGEEATCLQIFKDEENFYLNNLVYDQRVLSEPISIIAYFTKTTKIFLNTRCFNIRAECFDINFTVERVVSSLFPSENWVDLTTHIAPTKRYKESHLFRLESANSVSSELGLYTIPTSSTNALTTHTVSEESIQFNDVVCQNDETFGDINEDLVTIVPTVLDKQTTRRFEIAKVKDKLQELFANDLNFGLPVLLPTVRLNCSKKYDPSDKKVTKLAEMIRLNETLSDGDPIVVCRRGDTFEVLNGNMRVAACKTAHLSEIRAVTLQPSQMSIYLSKKFFEQNGHEESHTRLIMDRMITLLDYIDVNCETLNSWPIKDLFQVFQPIVRKSPKLQSILLICSYETLKKAVYEYCESTTNLSSGFCRDLVRKFRQTPHEVLELFGRTCSDMPKSESVLQRELRYLKPNLHHLLVKKGVTTEVATDLVNELGADEEFRRFASMGELRKLAKFNQKEAIKQRFAFFKAKTRSNETFENRLEVIVDCDPVDYDLLVTASKTECEKSLKRADDVVVVVVGSHVDNCSNHTMFLPDRFGVVDASECLHNHTSISIVVKKNGELLEGKRLSQHLKSIGFMSKTIIEIKSFENMFQYVKKKKIQTGGVISAELLCEFGLDGTIFVTSESTRIKIMSTTKYRETTFAVNTTADDV